MPPGFLPDGVLTASIPAACRTHAPIAMHHDTTTSGLRDTIEHAAHLLPAQGPIEVFIHHNTLHAFEHLPFEDAVVRAAGIYGTEPYLAEARYHEAVARGRIRERDIDAVLDARGADEGPALAGGRVAQRALRRALLMHHVQLEPEASARWRVEEGDGIHGPEAGETAALARERWNACNGAIAATPWPSARATVPARLRDLLAASGPGRDADALVHPLLIRACAAFLDQGVAAWPMPGRDRGFLAAVVELWSTPGGTAQGWMRALAPELAKLRGRDALSIIEEELRRLGTPGELHGEVIERTLLALRGWAGMVRQLEERPDRAPLLQVPARLDDFLAARMVMDRVAATWIAAREGLAGARDAAPAASLWTQLRSGFALPEPPGPTARALQLHRTSRLVGLTPAELRSLAPAEVAGLEAAIAGFDGVARRRLLHLAYERRHRISVLDGLALHARGTAREDLPRPACQALFCIDERFESVRRHFEELGPDRETFGAAGFFAVAMNYRGTDDWHKRPLCPIVVRPAHTVVEVPRGGSEDHLADWQRLRKAMGSVSGAMISGGRTLVGGSIFAAVAGAAAAVPLVARVAAPRLTHRLSRAASRGARSRVQTELALLRTQDEPLPDGTAAGFTTAEMTAIVRRLLEDIGLTRGFARIVAVLGHGSTHRNNPHASAYDCGACGGGRGGPNARAFAAMANDPGIRAALRPLGIDIPDDTWFVGGSSDTCSDAVVMSDADRVPASHADDLRRLRADLAHAARMGAHERSRRFELAPPPGSGPDAALRHVEERSEDLAQVRPEYCHATNAVCVVGRRSRTRGLYLDRRAFLVSYDPRDDADGVILGRTLAAVGPVCAGISLEYYFSSVDRTGYGCGTKLPHNITGLLGVMDGHASDLRTGLPVQTTEIHEPMRLLVVIDAPAARIEAAVAAIPGVKQLIDNGWIRVACWDERREGLAYLEHGAWVPHATELGHLPLVERSADWYAGRSEDLPPAVVVSAVVPAPAGRAA